MLVGGVFSAHVLLMCVTLTQALQIYSRPRGREGVGGGGDGPYCAFSVHRARKKKGKMMT